MSATRTVLFIALVSMTGAVMFRLALDGSTPSMILGFLSAWCVGALTINAALGIDR